MFRGEQCSKTASIHVGEKRIVIRFWKEGGVENTVFNGTLEEAKKYVAREGYELFGTYEEEVLLSGEEGAK